MRGLRDLKSLIKNYLPIGCLPLLRKLSRPFVDRVPKIRHAYGRVEEIDALKCVVSYNKYGGYCVPESALHRPAAKAVLSGRVYEPKTIDYMMEHCGGRDIVHAGTFFGDFIPALAGALGPSALLWAFEPNQESFRCAKITVEINDLTNVRLTHAGLGSRSEQLFVQTSDGSGRALGGASRIIDESNDATHKDPVRVVTIDEAVPSDREIGILQLDVEGYEKEALMGAHHTIRRFLPILILEALPDSSLSRSDWFEDNVVALGYRKTTQLHGNSVYVCDAP